MRERLLQWVFVLGLAVIFPSMILNVFQGRKSGSDLPKKKDAVDAAYIKVLVNGHIESIELEEYVLGVVLAEMPIAFDVEALKAQAVLARTYCLKRASLMDKHTESAVCTDPACCQGYCDPNDYFGTAFELDKANGAVSATDGEVLTYCGELIDATYFSCSGGKTEAAVAVWGKNVPYLQSVESPGEQGASHFISTVVMSIGECTEKLGVDLSKSSVTDVTYTEGGGVDKIIIGDSEFSGVEVRELLNLKSTAFQIRVVSNDVIITVKGYGHRVGMSQYGANAMACTGSVYTEILSHYYSGTELTSVKN